MSDRTAVAVLLDLPLPAQTGVDLRVLTELKVLRALGWRTVAVPFATSRERADPSALAAFVDEVVPGGRRVESIGVVRRAGQRLGALAGALGHRPMPTYPYAARYDAIDGRAAVVAAVRSRQATVVLLPTMLAHWAPDLRAVGATVIGDSYDVQSHYARTLFRTYARRSPWRAPGLAINVLASGAQERLFLPLCEEIWVTTPLDAERVGQIAPGANVLAIGNGLDADDYQLSEPPGAPVVGFIGDYSYAPNLDAARVLAQEVWPAVRARCPAAALRLAGRGLPAAVADGLGREPGVDVVGVAPDAAAFVRSCTVLAMPIRTRGGLPLKLVEGLASGRPVVGTPALIEGTGLVAGRDLLVTGSSAEMADAVATLLLDPVAAAAVGGAGRLAFEQGYSLQAMVERARSSSILAHQGP